MQRDIYKNEELARRVAGSIVGTNGTTVRERCKTPEDFYTYWLKKQVSLGRDDYLDYANIYQDEIMVLIKKLYKKPKTLKTKYHPITHFTNDGYISVIEHRNGKDLYYITIQDKKFTKVNINKDTITEIVNILKKIKYSKSL